jgi:DNA-binding FadR family transcriptional regulator
MLHGVPRAPYLLAADALRRGTASGGFKPGDRLPSLSRLEERFHRETVRSGLRVLHEEGLIDTAQGRDSYVCDVPSSSVGRDPLAPDRTPHTTSSTRNWHGRSPN